jgi:hypothetical protein
VKEAAAEANMITKPATNRFVGFDIDTPRCQKSEGSASLALIDSKNEHHQKSTLRSILLRLPIKLDACLCSYDLGIFMIVSLPSIRRTVRIKRGILRVLWLGKSSLRSIARWMNITGRVSA